MDGGVDPSPCDGEAATGRQAGHAVRPATAEDPEPQRVRSCVSSYSPSPNRKAANRPSRMPTTRSATSRTLGSWVTITRPLPSSLARPRKRWSTWAPTAVSRLAVGSSARITRGDPASARAMATRCFCPPERSRGRNARRSPSPTRWSTRVASFSAARPWWPLTLSAYSTFSRAERAGKRLYCWKTKPIDSRRTARSWRGLPESHLAPGHGDRAGGGSEDAAHDGEQRRLAGARGSFEGHDLALLHVQGDAPQHLDPLRALLEHLVTSSTASTVSLIESSSPRGPRYGTPARGRSWPRAGTRAWPRPGTSGSSPRTPRPRTRARRGRSGRAGP